jgi:hypothetical protein
LNNHLQFCILRHMSIWLEILKLIFFKIFSNALVLLRIVFGYHISLFSSWAREELHKLKTYLIECAVKSKDGHLQIKDIKKYIKITFNVIYQPTNIYYLLHKLNLSSKIKKYDNQTQSEEAQGRLKKLFVGW